VTLNVTSRDRNLPTELHRPPSLEPLIAEGERNGKRKSAAKRELINTGAEKQ
jgi:hypothetical protein